MPDLDVIQRLRSHLDNLGLYAKVQVGVLKGESITLFPLPGGAETVFMDGTRNKEYPIQLNSQSPDQMKALNALAFIARNLEGLETLDSKNESYLFHGVTVTSLPSLITVNDRGENAMMLTISLSLTIHKGVNMQ